MGTQLLPARGRERKRDSFLDGFFLPVSLGYVTEGGVAAVVWLSCSNKALPAHSWSGSGAFLGFPAELSNILQHRCSPNLLAPCTLLLAFVLLEAHLSPRAITSADVSSRTA